MLSRCIAVLLLLLTTGCAAGFVTPSGGARPVAETLPIPSVTGSLPALCRRPAFSFAEGQALLDTIAGALAASGTSPGTYRVVRMPRDGGPRVASFAMRGDTALIAIRDTVGGHSLYHELVHAWAARLDPATARAMVESVFAADRIAEWDPQVTRWAAASYLTVINGLSHPDGFGTMSLSVTASALDTTHAGRLTRLFEATAPIVRRAPVKGQPGQTIGDALGIIARLHWQYAGHRAPREWDGEAERRFILASEVLAYARERHCLGG